MEVTKKDMLRWKLYCLKRKALLKYGLKTGLITAYDVETIDNLRNVYYAGIPLSIIILSHGMCIRKCYDRATMLTYGFGPEVEYRQVDADIDGIKLHPGTIARETGNDEHYSNHSFIERVMPNGQEVVYDTTEGLIFDKKLYYMIENPQITKVNDKKTVEFFRRELYTVHPNINRDRNAIPLLMPLIENIVEHSIEIYGEQIAKEFEMFKEKIGYEELCRELEAERQAHFSKKANQ